MKTSVKTVFALFTGIILLANTAAVKAAEPVTHITTLSSVKDIRKIVVSGNVQLLLVQDSKESVKVYDKYYSKNALVQQQGSTLRISSYADRPLSIVVYVKELNAIEAYNTAKVRTEGCFKLLNLDVRLMDSASADINAKTVSLFSSVKGASALKIAGTSDQHTIEMCDLGNLTMDQFAAGATVIASKPGAVLASR
jgi:hypothetical protein